MVFGARGSTGRTCAQRRLRTNLTQMRLARAARLLRDTDQPIAKIADSVGYGSQIALTRAFRREVGVPPGTYRTGRA